MNIHSGILQSIRNNKKNLVLLFRLGPPDKKSKALTILSHLPVGGGGGGGAPPPPPPQTHYHPKNKNCMLDCSSVIW